jgi:hypothetical protein
VRKSHGAVDGFEGIAEVVGHGVGGGDGLPSGLNLKVLYARAVIANFLINQAVCASIHGPTASAWWRPSRTSQPNSRTVIKYNRRTNPNCDLVSTTHPAKSQFTGYVSSSEAVQE